MAFDYAARDGGHFSRAAERHYRVLRTQALRQILAVARNGALKPDWRDTLDTPQRSATAHHIYTDGDLLAIEDLRQMDYAAWEPGHASSWRDALSAWYSAARQALHEDRALALQLQVTSTQDRDKTLASALRLRSQGVNAVDELLRLETAIDSTDVASDSASEQATTSTSWPATNSGRPIAPDCAPPATTSTGLPGTATTSTDGRPAP